MNRIVVGVDGSKGSRNALLWASDEADRRNARLEVVHAYARHPDDLDVEIDYTSSVLIEQGAERPHSNSATVADRRGEHAQELAERMAELAQNPDVVSLAIEKQQPAEALIEQAASADMLVVGSRGRGRFASLFLGSVGQQCAQYAKCPVVIIPAVFEAGP